MTPLPKIKDFTPGKHIVGTHQEDFYIYDQEGWNTLVPDSCPAAAQNAELYANAGLFHDEYHRQLSAALALKVMYEQAQSFDSPISREAILDSAINTFLTSIGI